MKSQIQNRKKRRTISGITNTSINFHLFCWNYANRHKIISAHRAPIPSKLKYDGSFSKNSFS